MQQDREDTMEKMLLLRVHFLDDRYHGECSGASEDWPPAPARLFQALVAGSAVGARLPAECADALRWLERSGGPPEIRAQRGRPGLPYTQFVPNNDLDNKGGDPARIAEIRIGKRIRPRHIEAIQPIVYGWRFAADAEAKQAITVLCRMADQLYQLGRGVDMAWAHAEVVDAAEGIAAMEAACGEVWRPSSSGDGQTLSCPQPGSLDSLLLRFEAHRQRFSAIKEGRKLQVLFTNPPKPRFRQVIYNANAAWRLFDLRTDSESRPFCSWPQDRAVTLVEQVRDKVAARLADAVPAHATLIERLIIGRGAGPADKSRRVRLLALPSIGHKMTNRSIRRLLIIAPPDCPLPFGDLEWACSSLRIAGADASETLVSRSDDLSMLRHYGIETGETYRLWRSITPLVLPENAARRRIDPYRRSEAWKAGSERDDEEQRACSAVLQALRHAEVSAPVVALRVQREPFSPKGMRAERFAEGTRFAKERLWHVEIHFGSGIEGPLVLGDGRYVGLGLLAPESAHPELLAFDILGGLKANARPEQVASALRRAVMARVQAQIGQSQALDPFFTGHEPEGPPLRSGTHRHLACVADLERMRLLLIPPHLLEGRALVAGERRHMELLGAALDGFGDLRAGPCGQLRLAAGSVDLEQDPLFGFGRVWESATDYQPTRYAKKTTPELALIEDVQREIQRRQMPPPQAEVLAVEQGSRGGLAGRLRLRFVHAQRGPLVIGRSRHLGGGVFKRTG